MGVLVQVMTAFILGFSNMIITINLSWPSSTILLFKSENTTLHRPMGNVEIGLFGSLTSFGSLIAIPILIGNVLDRLGRKRTAMLTSLFYVVAWLIRAVTNRVETILLAAFLSGCGNALFLVGAIYISEIAQDSIRGTLTSGVNQLGVGLLVSYFLGGALEYHTIIYTHFTISVIGLLMITVLKEPPVSLLAKGREEEAAKSLAFYRRLSCTSKEVITELNNIRRTLNCDLNADQSLTLVDEKVKPELESKKMSCWQCLKTNPTTRRQFYLLFVLNMAIAWQGMPVVIVYAEPMFATALGDFVSPNLCSVLLGFVILVAGVIGTCLTDTVGRRPVQIYSCLICGICCAAIGTQIVTEWFPKLTIPLFMCVFAASNIIGPGTVTCIISSEVFLPEVKSVFMMISEEWSLFCQFCCCFLFNNLVESIGLSTIFFFFSFVCCITTTYFFYFLPETKGLSVYDIQVLFTKKVRQ